MSTNITVSEIFKAAALTPRGPVRWGEQVSERQPGVYVIALVQQPDANCGSIDVAYLHDSARVRWVPAQSVIYIGRTRRPLSRRIGEFYRHTYGNPRPHRGGQDVLLLNCPQWVYWSPTENPVLAEDQMMRCFWERVGRFPFANRIRAARAETIERRACE